MNKLVLIILLLVLIGSIIYYLMPEKEIKAVPTIQYTKPIGPTQEPPYTLESEVING